MLDARTLVGLDELLTRASGESEFDDNLSDVEIPTASLRDESLDRPLEFALHRDGSSWFASTLGDRFYVGDKVPYQGRVGLMNTRDSSSPVYNPAEYVGRFKQWAYFINPTAQAESNGRFNCLNTYDSAGFTFGFLQFAAHVPDGDFVQFFRALLQLDERIAYFPELEVRDGRIVQPTANGILRLETSTSSEPLKRYLNPSGGAVEDREVLSAARFVHWSRQSQTHRDTQVKIGVQTAREKLRQAQKRMNLDGRSDKVCFVIMDILHQGRGTYAAMKEIVENNSDAAAYEKLLTIGATKYEGRIRTIGEEVKKLEPKHFGRYRYSAAENDLILIET